MAHSVLQVSIHALEGGGVFGRVVIDVEAQDVLVYARAGEDPASR